MALFDRHRLKVDGKIQMRNATPAQGGATREMCDIRNVLRSHHTCRIERHVHKNTIEVDILLRVRIDQVVEMVSGYRQDRLAIEFGIVKAVQKMYSAGTGSRETNPKLAGVFGVPARHE